MSDRKLKILVCDDEAGVRASIRLVLERDYDLAFASDGEEALAQFSRQPADLVLLDIKLPKKDGLEVLKELMAKQPPPRPHASADWLRVYFLTACALTGSRRPC